MCDVAKINVSLLIETSGIHFFLRDLWGVHLYMS